MFLVMGINSGRKILDYNKMIICSHCGRYGRYEVIMTYTYFSLFFIPIFKWGRRYYVTSSCCNSVYELNNEKGQQIRRGEEVTIQDQDLTMVQRGQMQDSISSDGGRLCSNCGAQVGDDYSYCPKCGSKL